MTQSRFRPATPPEIALTQSITAWTYAEATRRMAHPSRPNLLLHEDQSGFNEAIRLFTALHWITPDTAEAGIYHIAPTRPDLPPNLKRIDLDSALHAFARMAAYSSSFALSVSTVQPASQAEANLCNALTAMGFLTAPQPAPKQSWRQQLLPGAASPSSPVWHWTAAFDPWVVCSEGFWHQNHDGQWQIDIRPADPSVVKGALARLPPAALADLSRMSHQPDFARWFLHNWTGTSWRPKQSWRTPPKQDWALQITAHPWEIPCANWNLRLASGLYLHLHGERP